MALLPRQNRFVKEYILGGNAALAAVRAGYSSRSARQIAHRLLTKDDVQQHLRMRQVEAASRLEMTRERMLEELQSAFATAREQRDPMAMIAAMREIGRVCGFYAPEVKRLAVTKGASDLGAKLDRMTDGELLQLAS